MSRRRRDRAMTGRRRSALIDIKAYISVCGYIDPHPANMEIR
jgi:hypothetical protein